MLSYTVTGDHSWDLSCWTLPMLRCIISAAAEMGSLDRDPDLEACTAPFLWNHSLLHKTTLLHTADPQQGRLCSDGPNTKWCSAQTRLQCLRH